MRTFSRRFCVVLALSLVSFAVPIDARASEPQSGTVRLDADTPGYVLDSGFGRRTVEFEVRFDERFAKSPGVAVALVAVEAATKGEKRISLKVKQVFESGFILEATTWGDAEILAVEVDWKATPQ